MEEWKDIRGYEDCYQISSYGNVRSKTRSINNNGGETVIEGQPIRPFVNGSGYLQVKLHKEGDKKTPFVHKLVAEHFIENPRELQEVNHIDHNKLNCSIENLEWCTRQENMVAMIEFYGRTKKIKAKAFCSCGNEVFKEGNKCISCSLFERRVVERPSAEELEAKLRTSSFLAVGRLYGVSDNAIRKWCKAYGMSTKASDYK